MTTPPPSNWPPEQERGAPPPDSSRADTPGVPPAQPPGYPHAYGYPGYPMQRPTNGFAIASLVLGIVWLWWIGSILALIFGYVARKQIRERGEGGNGLAIAGIVLGWVGIGVFALFFIIGFAKGFSQGFSGGA
ncbi:MAG: DUF4190 domain-containing protein [Pseudonocardiaceae bacterium]